MFGNIGIGFSIAGATEYGSPPQAQSLQHPYSTTDFCQDVGLQKPFDEKHETDRRDQKNECGN